MRINFVLPFLNNTGGVRVVCEYVSSLSVPVVMHYPVGHTRLNATLPHGGLVELDADELVVRLVEDGVEVE